VLSCSEFLTELTDYLEGLVPAEIRRELEFHMSQCRTCQVILDSTRKTVKIVTETGSVELAEPLPEPMVARIMARVRRDSEREDSGDPES